MPRRLPFALIATATLVAIVWLWLSTTVAEPETAPETAPAAPQVAAPIETPPPAVTAAPERLAAASDGDTPPMPTNATWLDVLVVDGVPPRPVPAAEVHWTIDADWARTSTLPAADKVALTRDYERFAQRFGRRTRSDPQGRVRVAAPVDGATVHARLGDRYGFARVGGPGTVPEGGWRVALGPDRTLRVQVLDARGAPDIGATVSIRSFQADGSLLPTGDLGVETAAPDAIAEFRHINYWLRDGGVSGERSGIATSWSAVAVVPGLDDPGLPFDRDAPPAEPLVLRLPATGRLVARLRHLGRPLIANVTIATYRSSGDDQNARNRAVRIAPDAEGWANFPRVTLGGTLHVSARIDNTLVETDVAAPVLPDQEVRVELSTDGHAVLVGRLVGPDGKPCANATVLTSYQAATATGTTQLKTDSTGRFFWVLGAFGDQQPELRSLVVNYTSTDGTPLRADVAARPLRAGENDLGDVHLTAGALVAAGRFVYEGGSPKAQVRHVDFGIETIAQRRGKQGEELWVMVHGLAQVLRPDGTFEIRGSPRSTRHRLFVRDGSHLPVTPVEFALGKNDFEIAIDTGHTLAASCLVPEGIAPNLLRGVLRRPGKNHSEERFETRAAIGVAAGGADDSTAKLQWSALTAGTYTLDVLATGQPHPLVTIVDVTVPPPPGGDPRLRPIDLLPVTRALHVRLAIAGPNAGPTAGPPRPHERALVFVLPQSEDGEWQAIEVPDTEVVLPVPPGPVELLVVRPGCQPRRIASAEGSVLVSLEPWPTMELTFTNLPPLPEGMHLAVSAITTAAPSRPAGRTYRAEFRSGPLDAWYAPDGAAVQVVSGSARVPVGDGPHQLRVWLVSSTKRGKQLKHVQPAEILGGPGLAPCAVSLSAEELRAAAAEMAAGK